MSTPTLQCTVGSSQALISGAALENLSSGSLVLGSVFSNIAGDGTNNGAPACRIVCHFPSMTVGAGDFVQGWFLTASDGSTYEQGGTTSVTPSRFPDFIISPAVQTSTVVDAVQDYVQLPICADIKCLFQNELGAAIDGGSAGSGYVKIYPITDTNPSV